MEKEFAALLPLGTAVALSPLPIAAILLILLSKQAKINSIIFLLGWILGLFVLVCIASLLITSASNVLMELHVVKSIINGVLGVLLILFALKQWKNRHQKDMPKWMAAIETFSPFQAIGLGFLLATLNFKNTPMGIVAAGIMNRASASQIELLAFYLLLGSSTILIPVIAFLLFGNHIQKKLEALKEWLVYHNSAIMFFLFIILGAFLLSKAFGA